MSDRCGDLRIEPLGSASLVLEPLRVEHAVELAPLLDDPALHTFIGGSPASLADLTQSYARQVVGRSSDGSEQWLNWIVRRRDTGLAVGTVQATVITATKDASDSQRVAEVAWVIAREHQHRGQAREVAQAMVDWLRKQGVEVLIAHIHPDHQRPPVWPVASDWCTLATSSTVRSAGRAELAARSLVGPGRSLPCRTRPPDQRHSAWVPHYSSTCGHDMTRAGSGKPRTRAA